MSNDTFPFEDDEPVVQGADGWLNAAAREDDAPDVLDHVEVTIRAAADSLIATHADTGIDLTQAPAWLAMVHLTYPEAVFEGTGDPRTSPHILHAGTETGRYSLAGENLHR